MEIVEEILQKLNANLKLGTVHYYIHLKKLYKPKIFIPNLAKNLLIGKYLIPELEEKYLERKVENGTYLSLDKILENNIDEVRISFYGDDYYLSEGNFLLRNILSTRKKKPNLGIVLYLVLTGLKIDKEDLFYEEDPFFLGFNKEVGDDYFRYFIYGDDITIIESISNKLGDTIIISSIKGEEYSLDTAFYHKKDRKEIHVNMAFENVFSVEIDCIGII